MAPKEPSQTSSLWLAQERTGRTICGFILVCGADYALTHRNLGRLRRRGPDGVGFTLRDRFRAAHARLAVVGRSDDGLQPIECGGVSLLFNGEVYSWEDIRESGERTDGAVLARLWAHEGPRCLRRLRGFWAFAAWDEVEGHCHLVRDQFGVRPLYYAVTPEGLVAGSTIRAVVDAMPRRPSLDERALSEWARYQMPLSDRTFFEGVRRVMPGHYVRYNADQNTVESRQYEDIWETGDREPDDDWIAEARGLLQDAVRDAARADVEVTTTCSGGLDSSVVTRLAKPDMAFHANYSDPRFNETQHAKAVVAGTETRLYVVNADETPNVATRLDDIVQDQDDITVGSVVLPLDELMLRVSRVHTVVLLGTGGDELFGGYARLEMIQGVCSQPNYRAAFDAVQNAADGLWEDRYRRMHTKGDESLFTFFDRSYADAAWTAAFWKPPYTFANALNFERRWFLPALLTIDDRMTGRHGLEGRPALLHQDFVRHVAQVRPDALIANGLKSIGREVFRPWLPESVIARSDKAGFPTPIGRMLSEQASAVRERLTSSRFRHLYELGRVRWTTEDPYDRRLFGLLQLDAWLNEHTRAA